MHARETRSEPFEWGPLLTLAQEVELPHFVMRIEGAHRVLVIGSCLGLPLIESVSPPFDGRELAVAVSGRCQAVEAASKLPPTIRQAGSMERILLPGGWADSLVGQCVLDEVQNPTAAFSELARVTAEGASLALSGPATVAMTPIYLQAGGHTSTTFWPVDRLRRNLIAAGFAEVASTDLTPQILRLGPRPALAFENAFPGARWIILEGKRTRPDGQL